MLNSYGDYYYKQYLVRGWTFPHLLCLFMAYLVIALPFYLSFSDTKFWLQVESRPLTTTYNYTGFYALQVNYLDGSNAFTTHQYSNIPGNSMAYPGSGFAATAQVKDMDSNGAATITLSGYSAVSVLSVNAILYYQVGFQELGKAQLCGWMATVPGNVASATSSGSLAYQSTTPVSAVLSNQIVNLPPYYPNLVGGFTYTTLANTLVTSPVLHYQASQQIATGSVGSRSVVLNYRKQKSVVVNYYPSLLETLKFRYSTYLAFAIIFYFIFSTLLTNFVREGLLDCQASNERINA